MRSMEASSAWSCLAASDDPAPVPVYSPSVATVIYTIQVVDLSTGKSYPDARVRACGVADINCGNPVSSALAVDVEGWVDVPLFRDFDGFLEITTSEAVPYLYYLTAPLIESTVEYPLTLVSLASLGPLVQLVGVQQEQNTGILAVRVFDCDGNTASGVTLDSDNSGTPWYFVDGLPSGTRRETGGEGLAGLVNVRPGLVVIDMKAPSGASIRGPQSLVIRPGWLSVIYLRPRAGRRLAAQ